MVLAAVFTTVCCMKMTAQGMLPKVLGDNKVEFAVGGPWRHEI